MIWKHYNKDFNYFHSSLLGIKNIFKQKVMYLIRNILGKTKTKLKGKDIFYF